jgi:hypothetical protein
LTEEEARELTKGCIRTVFAIKGVDEDYTPLPDRPLEVLLEANRIVRDWPEEPDKDGFTKAQMVCDPRLLAAMYAFEHYEMSPVLLLGALGIELTVVDDEE